MGRTRQTSKDGSLHKGLTQTIYIISISCGCGSRDHSAACTQSLQIFHQCRSDNGTPYSLQDAALENSVYSHLHHPRPGNAVEAWANHIPWRILRTTPILVSAAPVIQAPAVLRSCPSVAFPTLQFSFPVRIAADNGRIFFVPCRAAVMIVGRARGRKRRICRRAAIFSASVLSTPFPPSFLWPLGSLLGFPLPVGVRFPRRAHHGRRGPTCKSWGSRERKKLSIFVCRKLRSPPPQ